VAATRLEARPRGAGPLGHLTAWIYRWSGRAQVAADPAAYLRRWRDRSALARAAEPVRSLVAEAVASAPPALRQAVARIGDDAAVSRRISDALDRSAAVVEGQEPPRSLLWPLIGGAQYVVTAVLLFAAIWVAFAMFASVAVGTSELPALGAVPTPLVLLAGALVGGFVLARVLGAHAGWLGRRWAARLGRAVTADLAPRLDAVLAPLDALEAARARLARAARVAGS
ncbi:MAG TPA: hypothetical protein VFM93_14405, partial [Candidatus Limnocylindria bacterium]|nr:hypothetical protein [Candidatus Limnocylindria bacterium]